MLKMCISKANRLLVLVANYPMPPADATIEMQLKTILNHRYRLKGFVYGKARIVGEQIEVEVRPRQGSKPRCGRCGRAGGTYDTRKPRRFDFVPILGMQVLFVYAMRRVNCPVCGVVTERIDWARGKERMTDAYKWFLSSWARRLPWVEVARVFGTSWNRVYRSVRHAVAWGIANQGPQRFEAIGVDEIASRRGHRYLTVIYQIDEGCRRLLWVARGRREDSLREFLELHESTVRDHLRFICTDMWRPYLNAIAEKAGDAVHVLDRFHIVQRMNKAVDKVRAAETRRMREDGYEPILKHSRWCLLKRKQNRTKRQTEKLADLLQYNLKTMRAYLMKEDFDQFWSYSRAGWAARFLDQWCTRAMRSKLDPMKDMAKTLRNHRELLLNWFKAHGEISNGAVEGLNNKAKVALRKSYGFKSDEVYETVLYHELGKLPEHELAHRFC